MSYVMELHEAHKARSRRLFGVPEKHGQRLDRLRQEAEEEQEAAVAEHWPEMPPPVIYDDAVSAATPSIIGEPNWKRIIKEVGAKHRVSVMAILSARRERKVVAARHEAMYRLSEETMLSLPGIGKRLGGKDHTTVIHGIRKHRERMGLDEQT